MNLSVPSITLTDPLPPPKYKIHDELTVNLWDRWELDAFGKTFEEVFDYVKKEYKLCVKNVFLGSDMVYMHETGKDLLTKNACEYLEISKGGSVDLTIACSLSVESN